MHICCTNTPIFRSINCITLNYKLSCSLYAYVSSLRYQPLKLRYIFDYCRDMAGLIKSCFRHPCTRKLLTNLYCYKYHINVFWYICMCVCARMMPIPQCKIAITFTLNSDIPSLSMTINVTTPEASLQTFNP